MNDKEWEMLDEIMKDRVLVEKDDSLESYITGTGQRLFNIHTENICKGGHCPIHNPSNHPMKDFPTHWRDDRGIMERICPHGVGHPDPDDINVRNDKTGAEGVHGCDGCCSGTGPEINE